MFRLCEKLRNEIPVARSAITCLLAGRLLFYHGQIIAPAEAAQVFLIG
jgi:hypothetical protein